MKYAILNPYFITSPEGLVLPRVDKLDAAYEAYLVENEGCPGIFIPHVAKKPYQVNFQSELLRRRLSQLKRELLVRACCFKPEVTIIDATAGFGRDSFMLAAAGAHVWMIERNPVVGFLLRDGLSRLCDDALKERLKFEEGESMAVLQSLSKKPDVIYLDPMFEAVSHQAKVKKELQILRHLLADAPQDQKDLLPVALTMAGHRVVVKRAIQAAPLNNLQPTYRLLGKDSRFDVYQVS